MAYQIGDRIGDYQIVDVLGAGGMGKVYKVRNVISERVEAMKVLLPNLESDPDLADRFMREIKVQASLQHQNIAALHTALRVNNQLIMLIEFVEGITLEAELRKGPVPVAKAVDYIQQVLSALSYAHAHGVVHRDIKPANMMLTPSGSVKLMDFGIARMSAERRLTQTGRTVGSLFYMSPEQIQGAVDLDARSDLYSLGVTLYELVTNRRPFQGDSDYSIMAAHLSANPVAPIEIDRSLPPMLNEVILMAIEKDASRRFQTADAFRSALESVAASLRGAPAGAPTRHVPAPVQQPPIPIASNMPPPPPPVQHKSRRGLYMAIGSVVTLAVLVVAALQGPKLFRSSSASSQGSTQGTAATQQPRVPQTTPPVVESPTTTTSPVTTASTSVPPTTTVNVPVGSPSSNTGRPPQTRTPAYSPQTRQNNAPPAQTSAPPVSAQQLTPQQTVPQVQTPSSSPQQAAQPPVDTARLEALRANRELLMLLGTRANSIKPTLNTMKQQQARMGTNLRADISSAEQRMDFYLDDAEAALKAGDAARAKKNLDMAERAIETIEKFLGR